ncbi:MAG: hypothetical protein GX456_12540 [Verrucomicrobia bacterium]|nr:hypothetical protein [Verrucomicrobiota bacterium]
MSHLDTAFQHCVERLAFQPPPSADRRPSLGTTCLSPYRHDAENNVPVPISALAGAKRLECGSSLPLFSYAQTTRLAPYQYRGDSLTGGQKSRY